MFSFYFPLSSQGSSFTLSLTIALSAFRQFSPPVPSKGVSPPPMLNTSTVVTLRISLFSVFSVIYILPFSLFYVMEMQILILQLWISKPYLEKLQILHLSFN